MTKSESSAILGAITRSPIDFIYLFASDNFISKLSGVYRSTVYKKNVLQRQYVNRVCVENGTDYTNFLKALSSMIQSEYGHTPQEILNLLASGKNVAGKNWKEGVYGIGKTYYETFKNNSSITVNPVTGMLMSGGKEIDGQTRVYTGDGKIIGYSYTDNGTQYQSQLVGDKFYAGQYSDENGVFNADGSGYSNASAQSCFQNLFNYLPLIEKFVTWLLSLFQINTVQPSQIVASQSDWIKPKNDSDTFLYFVAGAAIVALLLRE